MFAENFPQIFPRFHPFDHVLKRIDQLKNSDLSQAQRRCRVAESSVALRVKIAFLFQRPHLQLRGRFLEFLVFDQLPDQIPARIVFVGIFVRRLLIDREQDCGSSDKSGWPP